jgi:hypothetical protein
MTTRTPAGPDPQQSRRLAALAEYGLFDTAPEVGFDRLARTAARAMESGAQLWLHTGSDEDRNGAARRLAHEAGIAVSLFTPCRLFALHDAFSLGFDDGLIDRRQIACQSGVASDRRCHPALALCFSKQFHGTVSPPKAILL